MSSTATVRVAFLLSLLLHLLGLFLIGPLWEEEQEVRAFRARLTYRPRFEPPPRLPVASINLPAVEMEYLESQRTVPKVAEAEPGLPPPPQAGVVPLPETASPVVPEFKPVSPAPKLALESRPSPTALESRPSPTALGRVDTVESEAMELLRVEDLARAERSRVEAEKAAIIPDLRSRRDISGFVTFTTLYLDGVSNAGLDRLARYMRDHTRIFAQVRHRSERCFLSEQLLLYPIHFMYPGKGGSTPDLLWKWRTLEGSTYSYSASDMIEQSNTERFTYFSEEKLELLGRYLRSGGFLYVEGPSIEPAVRGEQMQWWLNEMIVHVHDALFPDGRYFQLPPTHPIYHAFFDLSPREQKTRLLDVPVPAWYFREGAKDWPGLWGVELDGELVAVFNDTRLRPDESAYGLKMMTNIVVYALSREGGLTRRRAQPAWKQPRPQIPLQTTEAFRAEDDDIYAELGASLALVSAPLGSRIDDSGLRLRIDGSFSLELLRSPGHAVLLHNLPSGRHRIELDYGGTNQQLGIDLAGGHVLTARLSLKRLFFFEQVRLRTQREQIPVEDWLGRFSDLEVEEVFLDEEELPGSR